MPVSGRRRGAAIGCAPRWPDTCDTLLLSPRNSGRAPPFQPSLRCLVLFVRQQARRRSGELLGRNPLPQIRGAARSRLLAAACAITFFLGRGRCAQPLGGVSGCRWGFCVVNFRAPPQLGALNPCARRGRRRRRLRVSVTWAAKRLLWLALRVSVLRISLIRDVYPYWKLDGPGGDRRTRQRGRPQGGAGPQLVDENGRAHCGACALPSCHEAPLRMGSFPCLFGDRAPSPRRQRWGALKPARC